MVIKEGAPLIQRTRTDTALDTNSSSRVTPLRTVQPETTNPVTRAGIEDQGQMLRAVEPMVKEADMDKEPDMAKAAVVMAVKRVPVLMIEVDIAETLPELLQRPPLHNIIIRRTMEAVVMDHMIIMGVILVLVVDTNIKMDILGAPLNFTISSSSSSNTYHLPADITAVRHIR